MRRVFITGGAGFIGRRLSLSLQASGHHVTVLDSMHPQVHSNPAETISQLRGAGIDVWIGDVRDQELLTRALVASRAETAVHLAAETGTGQSYAMPSRYCDVNVTGTARLIEAIRSARESDLKVQRVVLAGSRAVYGEGACLDADNRLITGSPRLSVDLEAGDFEPKGSAGNRLVPVASSASRTDPAPASIYASSKLMQEYLFRQGFEHSDVECVVLRLQNVYGAGQSLHNPYTGVLSIFVQQLIEGRTLNIYEDGQIVRDFVYVSDVVDAFQKACEIERAPTETIDIGTGKGITILEVATMLIEMLGGGPEKLQISGDFRPGDVRHAVADIAVASAELDWTPSVDVREGLSHLVAWARSLQ